MISLEDIKKNIIALKITLLPPLTLDNIRFCIEETVKNNIEGDFIETGVWQGGSSIYARMVYKSLGSNKKIFVADSFEGLPKPNIEKYPIDKGDNHWELDYLKVSLETVKKNFEFFEPLDDSVVFLKGWFKDTLPIAPIDKLSVLRLDGDMYESTMDALSNLYPKLSIGGYCIIDDFGHTGCIAAVKDYRANNEIVDEIKIIDDRPGVYPSAYWKKTVSNIIETKFNKLCKMDLDINEHLPLLKKYACECESITEMGVRSIVSTWAFLAARPKKMISIDILHPISCGGNIDEVYDACRSEEIDFKFIQASTLEITIEETDLLFIDTLHTYDQLKQELALHGNKAKKYLIFHDTEHCKDMAVAIYEFIKQYDYWKISEVLRNNNGLIILNRV